MEIVMRMEPNWNWGEAWNKVRQDLNTLAWLFEEPSSGSTLRVLSGL